MRWDGLFADLEGQAAALDSAERAAEVESRARAELGAVGLVDRLRPATGTAVRLRCLGGEQVRGELRRVGPDWLLVGELGEQESLVNLTALGSVAGLGRWAALPGTSGLVGSRLGLRHVLRGIARDRSALRLHLVDGSTLDGTPDRVGGDFLELAVHSGGEARRRDAVREVLVVPFAALALARRASG
jgi:hypothetical protein